MAVMVRVALDAMGGDNAPGEIVKGALAALRESEQLQVILVGKEDAIRKELEGAEYPKDRLSVVHASEEITCDEAPVYAVRTKRDSSLVVAMNLVHKGEADAFVSAGSTGAILVGSVIYIKRIRGIERTPLAPLIPTEKGVSLLIDCGANVDAKPLQLVQFARMGSIYMEYVVGVKNPTVGLVNIGVEEEKGNQLVKDTYPLLKEQKDINFIGSVEAREIPHGAADVIVCEAFVGNVILKLYEGLAMTLVAKIKEGMMSSVRGKIGGALAKPALKKTLKSFDSSEHGGAPMLGLNGLVVKTHGSSKAAEVKNSLLQCITFTEQHIVDKIRDQICADDKKEEASDGQ